MVTVTSSSQGPRHTNGNSSLHKWKLFFTQMERNNKSLVLITLSCLRRVQYSFLFCMRLPPQWPPLPLSDMREYFSPVLEGSAELVGIDGQLETEVVGCARGVRKHLHNRVLAEHITTLERRKENFFKTLLLHAF